MASQHNSGRALPKRELGKTGLRVSEISLGTSAFSGIRYGATTKVDSTECLEHYLNAGGNFIDTARVYGDSENIIGEVLGAHGARANVVLATKTGGNNRDAIAADLAASLNALRTDHVEVYYLHRASKEPDRMRRSLEAMQKLKDAGLIKAIGMSVPSTDVDGKARRIARQYLQTGLVDVIQLNFSVFRQGMREIFDVAARQGVGIAARGVLENGFLSGKYAPGRRFNDHRARWTGRRIDRILGFAEQLKSTAVNPPYQSLPDVAIRFVLDEPEIASAIVGARTAKQIDSSLRASELPPLTADMRALMLDRYARLGHHFNLSRWWHRWGRRPAKLAKRR